MCGITGWVDFSRDLTAQRPVVAAMTDALASRGPDGEGFWLAPHVALGHRRLSVIDRAGGHQPMVAEQDGRTLAVITYCSEVYNFRELRAELEAKGHRFRTTGDTEVVLRSYLEWGDGLAERLNGIFAFGVWDVAREELVLVRDRLGVKPLYYYRTPTGLVFASEPKAILTHPEVSATVDADGLRELLSLAKTPGAAIWRGIHEVRPGEVLRISHAGVTSRRYWALEAVEHRDDLPTTIRNVRHLLADAVARQTVADVPLGILLSGGLDSSVVTALADRTLREKNAGPVRTFAVDFAGYVEGFHTDYMRETPDAPYVKEMAEFIGSRHTDIVLSTSDLTGPAARAGALRASDFPFGRGDRDTSLYLLCKAVSQHCTAALTGESSDEVFGGYWWFHDPEIVARPDFPWLAMFGHVTDDGPDSATSLLDVGLLKTLDLPGYRHARYHEALAEVPHLDGVSATERRMREICYLTLTRLMQLLLDRMDRMSMSAPIEVRVPFCDHRLVEYVFNTPWSMKSFDGREKSLLRAAAADLVPPSVLERRKAPFPATQDVGYEKWLRSELAARTTEDGPITPLLNLNRARRLAAEPTGPVSSNETRSTIELVLRLDDWLRAYDVRLDVDD
ncbi:asparagine synthase (glutamine-hydrolyzing) [Streptomyces sp. R08]|uniref:asparagine synthase (glutamine-hydrolyzing) n=1 Tax=Streptomyces sp. R08 TaxID=3238624 RepID=A0AB39MR93_9ACTN